MAKVVLELDQNTGGVGTVTSVGLVMPSAVFDVTPATITSSGTSTVTFDNQSPNLVFASPSSGGAGQPLFRSLVTADMPSTALQGQFMNLTRNGAVATGATNFIGVVADVGSTSGSQFSASEAPVQSLCPYSIQLTSLRVRTANIAPANITINIRVNGSPVGNTLTITNGQVAGTYSQNQTSVAVAQDALIAISVTVAAGSGSSQINSIVVLFRYA